MGSVEPTNCVKNQLIELSERIVDCIETIENTDSQENPNKVKKASKELHHIGDELLLKKAEAEKENLAYINFMLGSVCYQLGYLEKAEESYREALEFWPEHVGILNELFLTLVDLQKFDEAYLTIQLSIKFGGETPDVLQNMATVLVQLDRIPEAKAVLFNCISKFPNDHESQVLLNQLDQKN
jgi:tetratricopeptide (TPR) repeat protein